MKLLTRKILIFFSIIFLLSILIIPQLNSNEITTIQGLPHRRIGETPYNENQSLYPRLISTIDEKDAPTSGFIENPTEYDPIQGILITYISGYHSTVVTDLVVELTHDDAHDEIAYVFVSSYNQMNSASNMFTAAGANMSKVEFIIEPLNSIWIRDYGPHFIKQGGTIALVDSHYWHYRPLDNFIPTLLGDDHFIMPTYDIGLSYDGGNFIPGPDRSAFVSELIISDNPSSQGFNETFIAELYRTYQGIDNLHIMPQLPVSVDWTGHIDMWMHIVDESTVIISRFQEGTDPTAIEITDNAEIYMENLGFEVYRVPAWNVGSTHYTYTNAFRVNDRYFIPSYVSGNSAYADEDDESFDNFSAAAGTGIEIIPIDCYSIIPAGGAIHCIIMQVPRYIDPDPSVHVLYPDGGEIIVAGTTEEITWAATDTYNREIPQIDLYYSIDAGSHYHYIDTTTNTGYYQWSVPDCISEDALIKVVATSEDNDQGEGVSIHSFTIGPGSQIIYDFSTDAGVDKFCWGSQTSSWDTDIDNTRLPVTTEINTIDSSAYDKIAYSDATGGDSDTDRYISPNPSYYKESTHVYEFTIYEEINEIDDIEILWEGYADTCTQIEMYVWDYLKHQWCDGIRYSGQNRFIDNWAGNRDGYLSGHITSDIDHYIDENGKLTILLYVEKGPNSNTPDIASFHDYVSVTISTINLNPLMMYDPINYDFNSVYANQTYQTTFDIWNAGIGIVNYTIAETCDYIDVQPIQGNSTGEHDSINIMLNTTNLQLGPYQCEIEIQSNAGNGTFLITFEVVNGGTQIEDINQSIFDRGFPIRHAADGDWAGAQNLTSNMNTITSAQIYMRKFGNPEFNLTVELRTDHPEGTLLDSLIFSPSEIQSNWYWHTLDFNDQTIPAGTNLFIVCPPAPSGVTTSFGYEWGYAFGDQYQPGAFWFTRDGGALWRDLPTSYEFVFKTYGFN